MPEIVASLRGLLHRLRVWLAPTSYAREVQVEVRFHLELEAQQQRAVGLGAREATDAARRRFGNVTYTREEVRRMSGMDWIDRIRQDLIYAVRGLRQAPGFTAAVVITLALGLGINAAMFSFLDQVFIRPPAGVSKPDEIRRIYSDLPSTQNLSGNGRIAFASFGYPQIRGIAQAVDSSTAVGAFTMAHDSGTVVGTRSVLARRGVANANFFRILGVRPMLGQVFEGIQDRIETPTPVAIISYDLWQRAFDGDAHVVGKTLTWQDRPLTVVGVTPKGFTGIDLDRTDFWTPPNYVTRPHTDPPWYESYQGGSFALIARLPTPAVERRFLDVGTRAYKSVHVLHLFMDSTAFLRAGSILRALGPGVPDKNQLVSVRLGGVALLVLLIAIANVSNLLLVRATRRGREIAVRRALGVSRWRLFEQLFVESFLLSALAGAVSMLLAFWAGTMLRRLLMPDTVWSDGPLGLRSVSFAGLATLLVALVIGLAPAAHAWGADVVTALRAGARGLSGRRSRIRSGLLVVQASLSVVLLVGAGLFVRSLEHLRAIDMGFEPDRITIVSIRSTKRNIDNDVRQAMPALFARLGSIPGVEAIANTNTGPLQGFSFTTFHLPGRDSVPSVGGERGATMYNVSPDYFRATGMRILAGSALPTRERSGIVVSQTMAKAYWPGENAIGKCMIIGERTDPCLPVVGIVADAHRMGVIEPETPAQYYFSDTTSRTNIVLRTSASNQARVGLVVRQEVERILPGANVITTRSVASSMERELRPWRLGATLFSAMGVLALIVAAIGVYSVIAYTVGQRTNEMGIRIALGARMADITRLVIGDGLRTMGVGIVVGIVASIAMGRLVQSLLYEESAHDPAIIVVAGLVLGAVGILACVIPALRAGRVDPVSALRAE